MNKKVHHFLTVQVYLHVVLPTHFSLGQFFEQVMMRHYFTEVLVGICNFFPFYCFDYQIGNA